MSNKHRGKNYFFWKERAQILLRQKKFKEALKSYETGLKLAPKNVKHFFYNGLGNVSRYIADYNSQALNCYKKAVQFYQQAIKNADKNKGLYWSNLSIAYANLKDWDSAIKAIRKAIPLLKIEEKNGIKHGNQIKILKLEERLYQEYKKRTLSEKGSSN